MAKYRILSLDGGGSWALIQVMALQVLYGGDVKGHDLLKAFDLVVANSGGSLALGALIENLTLEQVADYFLNAQNRKKVFAPIGTLEDLGNTIFGAIGLAPKYSTAGKLTALRELLPNFGDSKMSAIPARIAQSESKSPHFIICGFDYDRRRATFFRSNLKSDAASFGTPINPTLAEAINASSTAPVKYFDTPAQIGPLRYWDGAIAGYNNPVLAGVVEALANQQSPENIQVLSIGTGSVRLPIAAVSDPSGVTQVPQNPTIPNNLAELAGSIIDDPPDAASFVAYVALRQPLPDANQPTPVSGSIIRMNPMIQPVQKGDGSWVLPPGLSAADFTALVNLDLAVIDDNDIAKIRNLAQQWFAGKVPNQPIRSNSENFACEVGHSTFALAKSAWEEFDQL